MVQKILHPEDELLELSAIRIITAIGNLSRELAVLKKSYTKLQYGAVVTPKGRDMLKVMLAHQEYLVETIQDFAARLYEKAEVKIKNGDFNQVFLYYSELSKKELNDPLMCVQQILYHWETWFKKELSKGN